MFAESGEQCIYLQKLNMLIPHQKKLAVFSYSIGLKHSTFLIPVLKQYNFILIPN
jgi:hypothetical protein